ncbi:MAG TPA: flagellar basal body P-ring formation chaperone FlgA [Limnochordia bacterium]
MARRVLAVALAGCCIAAGVSFGARAAPAAIVRLQVAPAVSEPEIRLGAIAAIETADAALERLLQGLVVAPAAPPGEVRTIDLAYLRIRLRQLGLPDWQVVLVPPPGISADRVGVRTLGRPVDPAAIRSAVEAAVRAAIDGGPAVSAEIRFSPFPAPEVPLGELEIRVAPLREPPAGPLVAQVQLAVDGRVVEQLAVRAEVTVRRPVLVAKSDLPRHAPLAVSDVGVEERAARLIPRGALADPAQVVGMRLVRPVRQGTVLTERMVEPVPDVAAGEAVQLLARVGAVTVAAEGVLLEDGRLGERVPVRNKGSGEIVWGRLADDKVVWVGG